MLGNLLHAEIHAANESDTVAGCRVFESAIKKYPSLQGVCADAGYRKTMENFVKNNLKKSIGISVRLTKEWIVLPQRWIVERTFAWFNATRRLSKDYEISISSSKTFLLISHSMLLLKRLFQT